jgi:hypothetical protein
MVGQCPHCSKPIPLDATFCPNCGGRLTMSTTAVTGTTPAPFAPAAPAITKAPRRTGVAFLAVIGATALVAVGAFLAFGTRGASGPVGPVSTPPPVGGVSDACKTDLQPLTDALTELDCGHEFQSVLGQGGSSQGRL